MEIFGIDKKRNKRYNRLTMKREANKSERKVLYMANIQAIPVPEQTKAIKIQFRNQKTPTGNNVKYTRDGRVKLTHSNAVEGESSKTYAIKDKTVLAEYVKFYKDRAKWGTPYMMEYAYIAFELCSGLRVSDIVCRTWEDVLKPNGTFREFIRIKQKKTSKYGEFFIDSVLRSVLTQYIEMLGGEIGFEDYIFPSPKLIGRCITRQTAWNICKRGADAVGIELSVGTHGLRKTFGYTSMENHKDDATFLAVLMRIFGHSSERITLAYCGIDEDNNKEVYGSVSNTYSAMF